MMVVSCLGCRYNAIRVIKYHNFLVFIGKKSYVIKKIIYLENNG